LNKDITFVKKSCRFWVFGGVFEKRTRFDVFTNEANGFPGRIGVAEVTGPGYRPAGKDRRAELPACGRQTGVGNKK